MVTVGLVVSAGAFVLFSQVNNLWIFYLAFMLMSLGQGLGGWVPLMAMLNHWFSRQRGTAMGISMSGMTAGALLVVPAIAWAIELDMARIVDDVVPAHIINHRAGFRRCGLAQHGPYNCRCHFAGRCNLALSCQNQAGGYGPAPRRGPG